MRPYLKYFSINNREKNYDFRKRALFRFMRQKYSMPKIARKFDIQERSLRQWIKRNWIHTDAEYVIYTKLRLYKG